MRRSRMLVAPLALVGLMLTGCGNTVTAEVIGMAAVTRSTDGTPVLLIKVCQDDIDTVSVSADREGLAADEPNPQLASWTSAQPVSGTIRIPVGQPSSGWSPDQATPGPLTFVPARGYIVLGQASQRDAEVTQVSFHGRALRDLGPGQVLVKRSQVWSRQRFEREACAVTG